MSKKLIEKWVKKAKEGTVHAPYHWASEDFETYCPVDNAVLKFDYEAYEGTVNEESIYKCPVCNSEWSTTELMAVDDALKVIRGEDPYKGAIFIAQDEDGEDHFFTRKWDFGDKTP